MLKILKRLVFFFLCCVALSANAAEKKFSLSVERNAIAVGEAVGLYVEFIDTSTIGRPEFDPADGLELRYRGPSSQINIVNGRTSRSITHSYSLVALRQGEYEIGPLVFEHKGDTYTSNSIKIVVRSREDVARDNQDKLKEYVFVEFSADKDSVYVNEYFTVYVDLYYQRVSLQNLQFPKLEMNDFIIEEFVQPQQETIIKNGVRYNRVSFRAKAYAKNSGEFELNPALVQVDMATQSNRRSRFGSGFGGFDSMFDDFFGSTSLETLYLQSNNLELKVKDLPLQNKPERFSGLVGEFSLSAKTSGIELDAGDPLSLTISLKGSGPLEQIKDILPKLDSSYFKVYDPQVSQDQGLRKFEYVIIPKQSGSLVIPKLSLWVFDSKAGDYRELSQGPFYLSVGESKDAVASNIVSAKVQNGESRLTEDIEYAEDIIYIKEKTKDWHEADSARQLGLWKLILVPLLFFGMAYFPYRHREKMLKDEDYIAKRKAPRIAREGLVRLQTALKAEDRVGFYNAMFETLQKYIAFELRCKVATVDQSKINELRQVGYDESMSQSIKELFDVCDMARYAASTISIEDMQKHYVKLKKCLVKR